MKRFTLIFMFFFGFSVFLSAQRPGPENPLVVELDVQDIADWLKNAPMEFTTAAESKLIVLSLPDPNGEEIAYRIIESPIIEESARDQYPHLKTYAIQGIENPSITGRVSITPRGIDAYILTKEGNFVIEPESPGNAFHNVYYSTGKIPHEHPDVRYPDGYEHKHGPDDPSHKHDSNLDDAQRMMMSYNIGATRRDFRMHVVADVEYSVAVCGVGPTRPCVEAAITAAVNAMNALYNRDMCVQLTLNLPNQTIYLTTNPAGFAPGGGAMDPDWAGESEAVHLLLNAGPVNGQAQVLFTSFDVGHLFSARVGAGSGGGGVAALGVVCAGNESAAAGGSGVQMPFGSEWVELLAHEFTHQFNADHTWNGSAAACTASQWGSGEAYEPGSGSTIVSYSGICDVHNIPSPGNTGYYHTSSINAVNTFIAATATCHTSTATGNTPPVPSTSTAGCTPNFNIPTQTPFEITGSATDANDPVGNLTYTWEQFDLGTRSNPILAPLSPPVPIDAPPNTAPPVYNGEPLFRSFFPSSSATRTFPQTSTILSGNYNGDQTAAALTIANWQGELLSEVARTITMRLTVRDNNAACGGVEHADAAINVVNTGAPFKVTSPDLGNPTVTQGQQTTITWNVAGTTAAPISCANVTIKVSTDGGMTYPHTLGQFPNTGSTMLCFPNTIPASTTARVRVQCGTDCFNFFDISNANFTIAAGTSCTQVCAITAVTLQGTPMCDPANPNNALLTVTFNVSDGSGNYNLVDVANPGTPLGQIVGGMPTGNGMSITGIFMGPTTGQTIMVNVIDATTMGCMGTPISVTLPTCPMPTCMINANAVATAETCAGAMDGTITVNAVAMGCNGVLEYSLDGGVFQASNVFMGVSAGAHTIVVRCSTDPNCTTTVTATVNAGTPVVITGVVPVAETCPGANDGMITVNATGPPILEYSINGVGGPFQTSNIFTGLAPGPYTVVVRVQGQAACSATSMTTVGAGVDTTPPVIVTCIPDQSLPCGGTPTPAATNEAGFDFQGGDIAYDCGPVTVASVDVQTGDACSGITIVRTYTVTETSSNLTATCDQTITIAAQDPPMIVCPADATIDCIDNLVLDPNNATATSSCGNIVAIYIKNPLISGVPNCDGTVYTYIYVAVDDCGKSAECEQQITIVNTPGTITVPAGGTVDCFEDIDISVDDATVTNSCAAYNLYLLEPVANGEVGCPGTTYTYTYRLIDVCGNVVEEDVVFTNGANAGPTITAPADLTCDCLASINPNPDNATVTTSCTIGSSVTVAGPQIFGPIDCPNTVYRYTYTVTDDCGRTATDTQDFTVHNDPPVFQNCPGDNWLVLNCEDYGGEAGTIAVIEAWIASVSASTSCGIPLTVFNNFNSNNINTCINNGYNTVTFRATDNCGRTSFCTGVYVVVDTEAPNIITPAQDHWEMCNYNTQANLTAWVQAHGGAVASDGCSGSNISWQASPANPQINCIGAMGTTSVTVQFIVTDNCGNKTSTTATFNALMAPGNDLNDQEEDKGAFNLFQNRPNPFKDETLISFSLPENMPATLTVFDVTGKVLKVVQGDYQAGYNEVQISRADLNTHGILFYQLQAGDKQISKKMILLK